MQDSIESRRLWYHVTESLRQDDVDKATEHKRIVSWIPFANTFLQICIPQPFDPLVDLLTNALINRLKY